MPATAGIFFGDFNQKLFATIAQQLTIMSNARIYAS
jgi:hypothetical protein